MSKSNDEHAEHAGIGVTNMDDISDFSWTPDPDKPRRKSQLEEEMETSPIDIDGDELAMKQ